MLTPSTHIKKNRSEKRIDKNPSAVADPRGSDFSDRMAALDPTRYPRNIHEVDQQNLPSVWATRAVGAPEGVWCGARSDEQAAQALVDSIRMGCKMLGTQHVQPACGRESREPLPATAFDNCAHPGGGAPGRPSPPPREPTGRASHPGGVSASLPPATGCWAHGTCGGGTARPVGGAPPPTPPPREAGGGPPARLPAASHRRHVRPVGVPPVPLRGAVWRFGSERPRVAAVPRPGPGG